MSAIGLTERGPPTVTGGLLESETELHELTAEFVFRCPGFQHAGLLVSSLVLRFLRVQLPPRQLLLSWAPTVLGLLVGPKPRLFQPG